jgi:hypothetical protein
MQIAKPRARARARPGEPGRRRLRRHPDVGIPARRRCRSGASSSPPTSLMINTAITGATLDIDGGQQLVA